MKQLFSILFVTLFAAGQVSSQDLKLPALSPGAKISQDFSTSTIDISYSRPSMRGRKVFGDVVAYGEVWRTGANSATKVKFGEDVVIGGESVKAGEYALYTIPNRDKWEVILNKGTGNWGASGYTTSDDVARFTVTPRMLDKDVQTFTINIGNIKFNSCNIELMWEKTKVIIPVKAENEARLSASISKAINTPNVPYFQAAAYYYETDQNLDSAYMYVNKAVEANPKAFWMYHMKAKIAAKQGKKREAIEAANKSIELAKGTANEAEYRRSNQHVISQLNNKK